MPTARELDPGSSGLEEFGYLRLRLLLVRLLQHIGHAVSHPSHSNQSSSSSVERAMGASHGATGWACEAARCVAHLVTLRSASEAAIGDRQRSIRRSHGIGFIRVWKRVNALSLGVPTCHGCGHRRHTGLMRDLLFGFERLGVVWHANQYVRQRVTAAFTYWVVRTVSGNEHTF